MSQVIEQPLQASAFRARRPFIWNLRLLKSRFGELPRNSLPGRIPATDSAVAPRRHPHGQGARTRRPPRPDPAYERRLEQLAQSMLAQPASAREQPAAPPPPLPDRPQPASERSSSPAAGESLRRSHPEPAPAEAPRAMRRAHFRERDTIGRKEPYLDPLAMPAEPAPAEPRRRSRKPAIALALLAGVGLGLSSAWWFDKLDEMDRALSSAVASSGASGTRDEQASQAPPPATAALTRPVQDEVSAPKVVTPPVVVQDSRPEPPAAEKPERKQTQAASPPLPARPPVASVDARKRKDSGKTSSGKAHAAKPAKASKSSQLASAAKNSKKAAPAPALRDDEIDRLRSQAYSESSRDRERKVLPAPKPPTTESTVAVTPISTAAVESRHSHKKELAQCEKVDGIFKREQCKWRVCKNEWGNNGCPSFPQQAVRF